MANHANHPQGEESEMKRLLAALAAAAFLCLASASVFAASSDTITVNYEVTAINEVSIDEASVTLTVSTATAGSQPDQAEDTAHYDITTNCATNAKKLTAAINTDMPSGLTLRCYVSAPTGGSTAGAVILSSTVVDTVTGIDAVAETNNWISFTLDATPAAGVVSSASKTCTLTLVDAS
jgi:predicted transcriptional regulator